jgi:hypothetical protein
MKILVDENIPRMTVAALLDKGHDVRDVRDTPPNRQCIHDRVMQGIARYPESQWPGMVVVMRDRTVSRWRDRRR